MSVAVPPFNALPHATRPVPDPRTDSLVVALSEQPHTQRSPVAPVSDEKQTADLHNRQFGRGGDVRLGRVLFALPYANWYRVLLNGARSDCSCCAVSDTSVNPLSTRPVSPISPGSTVLVWSYDGASYGYILGAVPDIVQEGKVVYPDWIEQGSNCGFKREQYYHGLLAACAKNAGVRDFSNSRPLDSTAAGEWGYVNDLGMGIFLDNFFGFFRVDESSGLFLNYLDRYVRLAGYNFNLETAGSELVARNDQGECLHVQGFTPYPWEALGLFDSTGDPRREVDEYEVQYEKPLGKLEPREDDQQPFWRLEEFRGYLGQGFMRQLSLPPQSPPTVNRFSGEEKPIGVFRETIGLDGSYGVASAHSLHFVKRLLLPVAKRKRLPEDQKDGDAADGSPYKFAGVNGEGDEHKVAATVEAVADLPHLLTAAGLQEIHAHLFNWKAIHPFHYHKADYFTPEESALDYAEKLQAAPQFGQLRGQQWLPRPEPVSGIEVDHRYGEVDYYETTAGISILPDGSVVIRDGYGAEIRMSGGSIHLSAPGDIWRQPGRSCVDWSGDDHIIKAQKSVDITSSLKDVRVKGEQNVELLAANGGSGRLLLENKAASISHKYEGKIGEEIDEASGILLKAAKAQVVGMAKEIYLRTGSSEGEIEPGNIVLDADKGQGRIHTISQVFERKLTSQARDSFFTGEEVTASNTSDVNRVSLDTPLYVDGGITATKGGLTVKGGVQVVEGHISTQYAGDGHVGKLDGFALAVAKANIAAATQQLKTDRDQAKEAYQQHVDQQYYQDGKIGNGEVQKQCAFSLRNEDQYGTGGFRLPETYWQHLAEGGGGAWEEKVVRYQQNELMPYPGKETWTQKPDALLAVKDKLYQTAQGRDADRDENADYETPEFDDWERHTLEGHYQTLSAS